MFTIPKAIEEYERKIYDSLDLRQVRYLKREKEFLQCTINITAIKLEMLAEVIEEQKQLITNLEEKL